MFTARYGLSLRVMYINPSKPIGHDMYRQFNVQQIYVLPTRCVCVFCVDLRTAFISLCSINWLVFFITETECVYCAVRTESFGVNFDSEG